MPTVHRPNDSTRYLKDLQDLHALRISTGDTIAKAAQQGNVDLADAALENLQLQTRLSQMRWQRLKPEYRFLVKWGIDLHMDSSPVSSGPTVSFVIPKGASRIEMVKEAQALVTRGPLVDPAHLEAWKSESYFATRLEQPLLLHIDGNVEGATSKTLEEQMMLLAEKNLWMPMWQDLVVAYVAYEVVRPCYETVVSYLGNTPLLGWWHEDFESFIVRAEGGCLIARNGRLFVFPPQRINSGRNITASALLE